MNSHQDPYQAVPTHTGGLRSNTSTHSRSVHGGEDDEDDYNNIHNPTTTSAASTSHSSYLSQSGESRPLTSFEDEEEEDDATPHASGASSGVAAPTASIPHRTSILSWDDSDSDEDDTYANIKRYAIDFSQAAAATDEEYSSHHEDSFHRTASDPSSNTYRRHSSLFQYMQHQFQVVRQQARQRRAQLLLQQSDRNWRQSTYYCWMTACDATDTGIFLVLVGIGIWLLLLWLWEEHRSDCWIVGTLLLVLRFSGRPCAAFLQRQQRRFSRMMILRQRSSSTASMHQQHHPNSTTPSSLGMRSMVSPPGRYNQIPAYTDHHPPEEFNHPHQQPTQHEPDVEIQLEDSLAELDNRNSSNPSTTVLVASNSLGNVELADMMDLGDVEEVVVGTTLEEHGMMDDDPTIHTI